jgi:hypothetical protein
MENDYYKKHHNVGFHTDVNWLDKIAYGNNYLDGNYRKDAMGNNNTIAIANTLDMIWKMYYVDSCDNKTLADNICKVGALMLNIIKIYSQNRLPNWEFVRDVLAVLGEILTRSMLQLYANNTQIISLSDSMEDTNDPGYMYTEAFYLEADENNNNNQQQNQNSGGKVQGATVDGGSAKTMAGSALAKSKAAGRAFIKWLSTAFAHIVDDFKKRHVAEINAVIKDNVEINNKISEAVKGDYHPALSGLRNFTFKDRASDVARLFSNVASKMDPNTLGTDYTATNILKKAYDQIVSNVTIKEEDWADDKKRAEALVSWALYGKYPVSNDNNQSQNLNTEIWEKVYKGLEEFSDNLKKVSDQFRTDLENCGKKIESQTKDEKNSAQVNTELTRKLANDSRAIESALMNEYFKYNYQTYNNIVEHYKSKGQQTQTETKTPEGQTDENAVNAEATGEQPKG